jgi:hypothetical protein
MTKRPDKPRRFRVRLGTLLIVIVFLALVFTVVVQSVRLQQMSARLRALEADALLSTRRG